VNCSPLCIDFFEVFIRVLCVCLCVCVCVLLRALLDVITLVQQMAEAVRLFAREVCVRGRGRRKQAVYVWACVCACVCVCVWFCQCSTAVQHDVISRRPRHTIRHCRLTSLTTCIINPPASICHCSTEHCRYPSTPLVSSSSRDGRNRRRHNTNERAVITVRIITAR